jgi:molecular chaperone HtpG
VTISLQKTSVDLTGLLRVLGDALYSTPSVAVRELVQNAHDSCERRRLEASEPFVPDIIVSADGTSLRVVDNGAGLTRREIEQYLATVGAGYTRTLRDRGLGEGLIGYFGLGFLSAFVISERTEVWTCSYQEPGVAHRFVSRSGETYTIEEAPPRPIGTEVRLVLREKFLELGDPAVLSARLERYCCMLPLPVRMAGGSPVNLGVPPWRLGPEVSALRQRSLSLELARRFEPTFQPITTLQVSGTAVQGVLWVQDGGSYATSDHRNVSVFVRGMLIGQDERDLLPRWAGFLGAVLESTELRPTASRESLQRDAIYERASEEVRQALVSGLAALAKDEPAAWRRVLLRHNEALLGAALGDPQLFDLVVDEVTLPTTEGDLSVSAIRERSRGKLYVTQSDRASVESILFRALRMPVVLGTRYAALPFARLVTERRGGQVVLLGTEGGDALLFQPAELSQASNDALAAWFADGEREVVVRRFEPSFLPFVLVTDRDAELKRRLEADDADRRMSQAVLSLARQFTKRMGARASVRMYVNAACPIISALLAAEPAARERALPLLRPLLALLSDSDAKADVEAALRAYSDALIAVLAKGA